MTNPRCSANVLDDSGWHRYPCTYAGKHRARRALQKRTVVWSDRLGHRPQHTPKGA